MRTPKITAKRVLGLALAGALAIGGTVAVADISQAATTLTAMKLSPATGSDSSTTAITATGKGFADSTGASLVKAVTFQSGATTCGTSGAAGTAASSYNVISATKLGIVAPATLTAGTYLVCAFDSTSTTTAAAMGSAKFVTNDPPTATTFAESTANIAKASALGSTVVTVTGTNFTRTTTATIDGLKATVTYVSATKITAKLPAHAAGTGYKLKVTTDYGSATTTDTVSFVGVASVSPTTGSGAAGNVVTITGTGFSAATFSDTAGVSVDFVPGGTTLAAGTTVPPNPCTSVIVESDTQLSCQAPALAGAYSVQLLNVTSGKYASSFTTVSKSATYTAANF